MNCKTEYSTVCRTAAKEKKPSYSRHIFMCQRNGGFDFQSRRFFAFTKIYDNLHGYDGIREVSLCMVVENSA
ncbi:hypothetical protein [Anaerocolumna jejuensis]|uniref:hypothetical protein n=1 Tax=Anaerocolumna jejuensis TaxID=259063 RepID=UPI001114B2BA|nr:hypothetical protein [Anaerocolumna jejuensis]